MQICAVELPSVVDIPILGHEGVRLSDDHSGHVTPIGQRASGNQNKTDPTVKLGFIHNFLLTDCIAILAAFKYYSVEGPC